MCINVVNERLQLQPSISYIIGIYSIGHISLL